MKPTGATKGWEYVEVGHGAYVRIGKFRISAHWQGLADSGEIRSIMRQIADGHSERERLREVLRQLMTRFEQTGEEWMSDPAMIAARAALNGEQG